jgi:hypothetical protein
VSGSEVPGPYQAEKMSGGGEGGLPGFGLFGWKEGKSGVVRGRVSQPTTNQLQPRLEPRNNTIRLRLSHSYLTFRVTLPKPVTLQSNDPPDKLH